MASITQKIRQTFHNFRTKGTICSSSKYLVRRMLRKIDFSKDLRIIQLGSGKGVFLKRILKKMTKNSTLTVFEIDASYNKYVKNIHDPRLTFLNESAENLDKYIQNSPADVIVSTLPFGSLPDETGEIILKKSEKALKKGGLFLQYQYFLNNMKMIERIFHKEAKLSFEPLNIPPAFIYKIQK